MNIRQLPAIACLAVTLLLAACGSSSPVSLPAGSGSSGASSGSGSSGGTPPADGVAGTPQPLKPGLPNTNCPSTGQPAVNATPPGQPQLHCAP